MHTFPAVTDLKRARPDARLHWVVEEQYVELARMHPGVDRIIPVAIRRWRGFGAGAGREAAAARAALRDVAYDVVIDSQGLVKSALVARNARRAAGARVHGFGWRTAREPLASLFYQRTLNFPASTHKITRYRGLMAAANGDVADAAADSAISRSAAREIDYGLSAPPAPQWAPARPYVVLLHSTARAAKLWNEPAWIALARALDACGVVCVLPFGTADEEARAQRIAAQIASAVVAARMDFVMAGGLLAHARAVVGLDTGFTHLAAAFKTPVVGVFCDSEPVDAHPVGMGPTAYCGGIGVQPAADDVLRALARVAPALGLRASP